MVMQTFASSSPVTTVPPEHVLSFISLVGCIVLKSLLLICGVTGNGCVIIYNVFLNRNKTPSSSLVVNLAITDILFCLFLYPMWIVEFVKVTAGVASDLDTPCKLTILAGFFAICVSLTTVAAIIFDRFLFIRWPFKYPTLMTFPRS